MGKQRTEREKKEEKENKTVRRTEEEQGMNREGRKDYK